MDSAFEFLSRIAVLIGLIFAAIELRQFRIARKRENMFALFKAYVSPEFLEAMNKVIEMPEGLSRQEAIDFFEGKDHLLYSLIITFESLGILVHKKELDLGLVEDFFSGPVLISWRKLERYSVEGRKEHNRDTMEEWFQWLAERMSEREKMRSPIPAYIEFKDWKDK